MLSIFIVVAYLLDQLKTNANEMYIDKMKFTLIIQNSSKSGNLLSPKLKLKCGISNDTDNESVKHFYPHTYLFYCFYNQNSNHSFNTFFPFSSPNNNTITTDTIDHLRNHHHHHHLSVSMFFFIRYYMKKKPKTINKQTKIPVHSNT